jgi:two-component system sensor histidine kinase/response regulator
MTAEVSMRIQRILVIDDNAANRQVAEGHLVAAGYSVVLAEGGEQGIAAFKERPPDLVLLDILMPGLDGFETCKRLRDLPGPKEVPIVFLTALGDLSSHQKAIDSGADDFLTKPISRTELLIRVRSLLWVKRLRDELSEGYDLIRSQRDALLRAQRQKEELSALVVHDLKNPLSAILGNAQYLVGESYLRDDDRDAIRDIVTSAEAMQRMVMNLLDISRSEDGTLVLKLGDLDLASLVENVCGLAKRRSEERGIRIIFAIGAPWVRGDSDLLHRLFENLLDNSIKYNSSGGTVSVRTLVDHGFVEIHVNDDGPGVPLAFRDQIFQKYVQLDRDRDAHPEERTSRGLGLAFCRLAAEAHGGRIWVEENDPKGSSFRVRIPLDCG